MSRAELLRRSAYESHAPIEDFLIPMLKRRIEDFLDTLPFGRRDFTVLDAGCGGQPFRKAVEERGLTYVSVDAQNPLGTVDYVAEIDGGLPQGLLDRGPFDAILCTEVLEHVGDWETVFINLSSLLKEGGRLLVTCPHFYPLHEEPYDFWRPTIHALRKYGSKNGLRVATLDAEGTAWDVLGTLLGANHKSARAVNGSLTNRSLAWAVDLFTGLFHRLLTTRWLQARVSWGTGEYPFYLTNVAVFLKSDCAG